MKCNTIGVVAVAWMTATLSAAIPEVGGVVMSQSDVSRTVTVTYVLTNAPAIITFDVQTNRGDGVWVSIGGENISGGTVAHSAPEGDVNTVVSTDGPHSFYWRPDLAWPDHRIENNGARAVVTAWAKDNPPDSMVMNLLPAGVDARLKFYPDESFLPGGILANHEYRTSQMVLRKIPAKGVTWTMGTLNEIGMSTKGAENLHAVTLVDNFYMGVFPVTQQQWVTVYGNSITPDCTIEGSMRPMEKVSYHDVRESVGTSSSSGGADVSHEWPNPPAPQSFLGLLRTLSGNSVDFDLPSDAQWEYACRSGWGNGYWNNGSAILLTSSNATVDGNMPGRYDNNQALPGNTSATYGPSNATAIVGSYAPNSWGLYDMHGNVAEWCLDWYVHDISGYAGAVNVNTDNPALRLDGSSGVSRVCRGGGWRGGAISVNCRSGARSDASPAARINYIGVRVAAAVGIK